VFEHEKHLSSHSGSGAR